MLEEKARYESNLHRRFIIRVLAPPFLALLVLSLIVVWQLNRILHQQAINNLRRSANTTAATLEREFSLRETVLKQTGTELFIIKSEYSANLKKLTSNRDSCRAYILRSGTFRNAPNGVCKSFLAGFAAGGSSLAALENEYARIGEELISQQGQRINERLSAFKQFFPETLELMIINDHKQVVSSAVSGVFKGSTNAFQLEAVSALTDPIRGKVTSAESFKLATFAFPISGGSVLAAYDLNNEHFVRRAWASAPIDRSRALAVLLDSSGNPAYPRLNDGERFISSAADLRQKPFVQISLDGVDHTVVSAPAGASGWMVAIASPTAAVLAPLREAQLTGLILIGLFLVSFLWVGTFFIRRMLRNIISLVSGAMIFGSGRLDYKINLDHAEGEFMRLADIMNTMAQRIATAEKAVDEKNKEFISVATHELRAPMTAIIGHLSLLKERHGNKLNTKAQYLLNQAYDSTTHLRDLVNDMLNVARLESGQSEVTLTPISIKSIIEDVLSTMAVVSKSSKVNLQYQNKYAADVLADEQHMRIIINNIVSNAIKYNRPGGKVTVYHKLIGDRLATIIEDNGLGIPDDQKAHLFEKFFRVRNEDRKNVTGTGLGLYITKRYVEEMRGELSVQSSYGKGTKISFSLPVVKPKRRLLKTLLGKKIKSQKQAEKG